MQNYDLSVLSPIEFESLVFDLLENEWGTRIERFKPGKDSGIDGRCAYSDRYKIIQCKHYVNSNFNHLINTLKQESEKVLKLNPASYVLVTSLGISPGNKTKIQEVFSPFEIEEGNILGRDDIINLLLEQPDIARRYYKLWIASTDILDHFIHKGTYVASEFDAQTIIQESHFYAITNCHGQAYQKLKKNFVVIISGVAGVGKTTLAKQLCLQSMAEGFEFVLVRQNIKEAYEVFDLSKKQIFYFDDFLGSNYLQAIEGNQDSDIVRFIRMVRKAQSRFVLTSRTNILNQAKGLSEKLNTKEISNPEYVVEIDKLSEYDRSLIFYELLRKSHISNEYFKIFTEKNFFKMIVHHHSYNPRLLEMITNVDTLQTSNVSVENYKNWIIELLAQPKIVWSNPFTAQLDDFNRLIICLAVLCGGQKVPESKLSEFYETYLSNFNLANIGNQSDDFHVKVKPLCNFFLKREMVRDGTVYYSVFNPSVSDYVLDYLKSKRSDYVRLILSIRTEQSLSHLCSYYFGDKALKERILSEVLKEIGSSLQNESPQFTLKISVNCSSVDFKKYYINYLSYLVLNEDEINYQVVDSIPIDLLVEFLNRYCNEIRWGNFESPSELYCLVSYCLESNNLDFESFEALSNVIDLHFISDANVLELFKKALLSYWEASIGDFAFENIEDYVDVIDEYGERLEEKPGLLFEDIYNRNSDLIVTLTDEEIDELIEPLDLISMYRDSVVHHENWPDMASWESFDHRLILDLYKNRCENMQNDKITDS